MLRGELQVFDHRFVDIESLSISGDERIERHLKPGMNVGVAVIYRGRLAGPAANSVAEHHQVSEVYHIIEGTATIATGGELVGAQSRPADSDSVRLLNGPGSNAASIRNPVLTELKAGDVIVIPAGTGHWFTKIDDHITYLMIRLDPDKIVPLKDEAASRADLAR